MCSTKFLDNHPCFSQNHLSLVTLPLLSPPRPQFGLLVAFSVIAGVIELPLCCSCFQCCRWCGGKMSWFKHFLLRAFMYACMSAILFVVSALQENSPAGWYFGIANGINTFLYIFAHFKGEVAGNEAADEGIMRCSAARRPATAQQAPGADTRVLRRDMAREKVREQAMAAASGVARDPKVRKARSPSSQEKAVNLRL